MSIEYYSKHVYGSRLYYLADPQAAANWYALSGLKTISREQMTVLGRLTGANFQRIFEPAELTEGLR